ELRLLGRGGRADHLRGGALGHERDLRRYRQAGAQPAAEEPEAGLARREFDVGPAPADEVGEDACGPAGEGPAERAVAGVEVQVWILRAADAGDIARRRRPQACPIGRL